MANVVEGLSKTGKAMESIGRFFSKVKFQTVKHSPEILTAVGVISTAAGAVLMCKSSLKVTDILEKHKKDAETIKKVEGDPEYDKEYSKKDALRDKTILFLRTGLSLARVYAPGVIIFGSGIACILAGHNVLSKRQAALGASFNSLSAAFDEYRDRVKQEVGEQKEKDIFMAPAIRSEESDKSDDDSEDEKDIYKKQSLPKYTVLFDEFNDHWAKGIGENKCFLDASAKVLNEKLRRNGYLFLNDVYDFLGYPKTTEGQLVGWIYDSSNPNEHFVDFGIYGTNDEAKEAFISGEEKSIWLTFNPDGYIFESLDYIARHKK